MRKSPVASRHGTEIWEELNGMGNSQPTPHKDLSAFSLNTPYNRIVALNMLLVCMWMIGGWK